jgi:hypothetical protein
MDIVEGIPDAVELMPPFSAASSWVDSLLLFQTRKYPFLPLCGPEWSGETWRSDEAGGLDLDGGNALDSRWR